MRYYYNHSTVYIRGKFKAVSTGVDGGIREVSTLFNHTVPKDFNHDDPLIYIRDLLAKRGYDNDAFGLLTAVWMQNLCVLQFDYITVFVTAGVTNPNPDPTKPHTINIIVVSAKEFSDAALLETIITVTEAKAHALRLLGRDFTGTTSDAVIVACEKDDGRENSENGKSGGNENKPYTYAGTFTEPGKRIYSAVLRGVMESIDRHEGRTLRSEPSYFIYSRYGDTGWFEWRKDGCPYYPCHFEGQACDFCYCPFYPCKDESLGEWIESSSLGERIFACSNCVLLHDPKCSEFLKTHPDATFEDVRNYCDSEKS